MFCYRTFGSTFDEHTKIIFLYLASIVCIRKFYFEILMDSHIFTVRFKYLQKSVCLSMHVYRILSYEISSLNRSEWNFRPKYYSEGNRHQMRYVFIKIYTYILFLAPKLQIALSISNQKSARINLNKKLDLD